jgi:hypothetical protein
MKTLKESLLSDIDTTIAQGDKWGKTHAEVETDIKYISDRINDFDPHSASASKWYLWRGEYTMRATIFFRTSKLTKYFNLPGKHIFITVSFNTYHHVWEVSVIFTNANKTVLDHKQHNLERVGNIKGSIWYKFEEKGIPNGKISKFNVDEFIQTYVRHMFNDIESFEQYIVKPYTEGIRPNTITI